MHESMIATGDFALLLDDPLRTILIELDAQLEAEASLLDYFRFFGEFRGEIAERFEAARAHIATLIDLSDRSTVPDRAHASSR